MHDQKCNNSIYRFLFWVFCPVLLMSIIIVASKSVYADNYMEVSAYYLRIEMLVPAFAAMVSKLYIQRNETPAKKFYYFYIVFIGILFFLSILSIFLHISNINNIFPNVFFISSIVGFLILMSLSPEECAAAGLSSINNQKMFLCILLFVVLHTLNNCVIRILNYLFLPKDLPITSVIGSLSFQSILPRFLGFFVSYLCFLGEEYGWRYFLQNELSRNFGKVKSILIVGLIWSVFHFPADVIRLAPNEIPIELLARCAVCISLAFFFGWVYEYTHNIWAVVIIHFSHNNLTQVWIPPENSSNLAYLSFLLVFLIPFAFIIYKTEQKKKETKLRS